MLSGISSSEIPLSTQLHTRAQCTVLASASMHGRPVATGMIRCDHVCLFPDRSVATCSAKMSVRAVVRFAKPYGRQLEKATTRTIRRAAFARLARTSSSVSSPSDPLLSLSLPTAVRWTPAECRLGRASSSRRRLRPRGGAGFPSSRTVVCSPAEWSCGTRSNCMAALCPWGKNPALTCQITMMATAVM